MHPYVHVDDVGDTDSMKELKLTCIESHCEGMTPTTIYILRYFVQSGSFPTHEALHSCSFLDSG